MPTARKPFNLGELRKLVNSLPESRDKDRVAVYDLETGERVAVSHVDTDCSDHTVIDMNFNPKVDHDNS